MNEYVHIELMLDVENVVRSLQDSGYYPRSVRLNEVDVDTATIWAGDDEENPKSKVILHITVEAAK